MEGSEKHTTWQGTSWDIAGGIDPYGIREVVIEFDNGDSDSFKPRLRDEFHSYELQQMATYIETVAASVRKGQRR